MYGKGYYVASRVITVMPRQEEEEEEEGEIQHAMVEGGGGQIEK